MPAVATGPQRPRGGDLSEHTPGGEWMEGYPAHTVARLLPTYEPSPTDRLEFKPARQMAGILIHQATLARTDPVPELLISLHGLAGRSQRFTPPRLRASIDAAAQPRGGAGVSCGRCQSACCVAEAASWKRTCATSLFLTTEALPNLTIEQARHLGQWASASELPATDDPRRRADEPDVVMACAGDIPTKEVGALEIPATAKIRP